MAIATYIEASVDNLLDDYVVATSTSMIGLLTTVSLTAITLYILTMGYAIASGEATDSVLTVTKKFFRIAFITGLALSAGEYQATVVNFIEGIQEAMISVFTPAGTMGAMIDTMSEPFTNLVTHLFASGTTGVVPKLGFICAGVVVLLSEGFLFIVSSGLFLLAKVSLTLVLAIGPIFIFLAIFPATQKYTEMWLAQAFSYVILNVLLVAIIAMLTSIANKYALHIIANQTAINVLRSSVSLLICCGTLCVVLLNSNALAASLSGGMTLSGVGRELYRELTRPRKNKKDKDKNGASSGSNSISGKRSSSSTSSQSGQSTSTGSPLYQRNVLENIRR